jgi:hypothetical protein
VHDSVLGLGDLLLEGAVGPEGGVVGVGGPGLEQSQAGQARSRVLDRLELAVEPVTGRRLAHEVRRDGGRATGRVLRDVGFGGHRRRVGRQRDRGDGRGHHQRAAARDQPPAPGSGPPGDPGADVGEPVRGLDVGDRVAQQVGQLLVELGVGAVHDRSSR